MRPYGVRVTAFDVYSKEGERKVAKGLKVTARQCVVIENVPYGIESAKRAGMFCIAVTTSLPKEYLKRADVVVDRLEEITRIIDKSCI